MKRVKQRSLVWFGSVKNAMWPTKFGLVLCPFHQTQKLGFNAIVLVFFFSARAVLCTPLFLFFFLFLVCFFFLSCNCQIVTCVYDSVDTCSSEVCARTCKAHDLLSAWRNFKADLQTAGTIQVHCFCLTWLNMFNYHQCRFKLIDYHWQNYMDNSSYSIRKNIQLCDNIGSAKCWKLEKIISFKTWSHFKPLQKKLVKRIHNT